MQCLRYLANEPGWHYRCCHRVLKVGQGRTSPLRLSTRRSWRIYKFLSRKCGIKARTHTCGIKYTISNELVPGPDPTRPKALEPTRWILCILFHGYGFLLYRMIEGSLADATINTESAFAQTAYLTVHGQPITCLTQV